MAQATTPSVDPQFTMLIKFDGQVEIIQRGKVFTLPKQFHQVLAAAVKQASFKECL